MPVHDTPVHPKTSFGDDYRYGCHSKRNPPKKAPGYWVKVREYKDRSSGKFDMVDQFIAHNMSVLCRYCMREQDLNCRGCEHESDKKYLEGYGIL